MQKRHGTVEITWHKRGSKSEQKNKAALVVFQVSPKSHQLNPFSYPQNTSSRARNQRRGPFLLRAIFASVRVNSFRVSGTGSL